MGNNTIKIFWSHKNNYMSVGKDRFAILYVAKRS
jgi:hypothetical protein